MDIFKNNELGKKLQIFPLNMKRFLRWTVETDTASSQQVATVLMTRKVS